MTIKQYIDNMPGDSRVARFAESIGMSQQAVYSWLDGEKFPSETTAKAIVKATGGAVTFNDIFSVERKAKVA